MSFDYSELATEAAEIIEEFGQTITITSASTVYDVNTGANAVTETTQAAFGVALDYQTKDIDGALIQRGDKRLLVKGDITTPEEGEKITVNGVAWVIKAVKQISPAGTIVMHEFTLRK